MNDPQEHQRTRNHSMYGTGLRWMSFECVLPDRVAATRWLTVFYVPLLPLHRRVCRYVGSDVDITFGLHEVESPVFEKHETIPLALSATLSTYAWALVTCCFLFGPIGFMIWWTNQRAALPLEIGFIFLWIAVTGMFPFWKWHRDRDFLESSRGQEYAQAWKNLREQQRKNLSLNWQRDHFFPMWVYLIPAVGAFFAAEELANFMGWNNKEAKSVIWVILVIVMCLPVYWLDRYLKTKNTNEEEQGSDNQ